MKAEARMTHTTIASTMHPVALADDGAEIYVNLIQSAAAGHIGKQPHLLTLAIRLLQNVTLNGESLSLQHDFGTTIGSSDVVETTDKDVIMYAKQYKQDTYTRFVKRRSPVHSSNLTLYLQRDTEGNYELHDIRVGNNVPCNPGSTGETAESKRFWQTHAVVFQGQALQTRTLTKTLPC